MTNKITFKRHKKETGLSAVGNPRADVDIKLNTKKIGYINAPSWQTKDMKWRIRIAVDKAPTKEEPADFSWITFKASFDDEQEARNWFISHFENINNKYKIYSFSDDYV